MQEATGAHVALLTQDAEPADEHWLARLLGGFELADDVAIVVRALPAARRRQRAGAPRARTLVSLALARRRPRGSSACAEHERSPSAPGPCATRLGVGRRGFFTDANACLARGRLGARAVPRGALSPRTALLAIDMLRAGYAKAFVPERPSSTPTPTAPPSSCAAASTSGAACARSTAGASPPRHATCSRSCAASSARRARAADAPRAPRRRAAPRDARRASPATSCSCRRRGAARLARRSAARRRSRRALSLEGRAGFAPLDLDSALRLHRPPTLSI